MFFSPNSAWIERVLSDVSRGPKKNYWCPDVAIVVLAITPICLIYVAHFLSSVGQPTGFLVLDMPYYAANGREIFERGNGFAYPNPYDTSDAPPVIYFQWLIWILGAMIVHGGIDPGLAFVGLGFVGCLGTSWLTLKLVRAVLPAPDFQRRLFLLAMWGGGLFTLWAFLSNLLHGRSPTQNLLAHDPFLGQWCLNWGRNLFFPTEAVYHMLTAASWLMAIKGRWRSALVFGGLLAATHPWSGLQLLLVLSANSAVNFALNRTRLMAVRLAICASMLATLLSYYMLFLNRFPEHKKLHDGWLLDWSLSGSAAVLGWSVVGLIAVIAIARNGLSREKRFFAIAAVVSIGLAMHDRFLPSVQPLHFTRGQIWMPLFLLALPEIQRWLISSQKSSPKRKAVIAAAALLAVADNTSFIAHYSNAQNDPACRYFLTADEQQMLNWIDVQSLTGVLVTDDDELSYLSATYCALTPYVGHMFNSPDREKHIEQVRAMNDHNSEPEWMKEVSYAILKNEPPAWLNNADWEPKHQSGALTLFGRR